MRSGAPPERFDGRGSPDPALRPEDAAPAGSTAARFDSLDGGASFLFRDPVGVADGWGPEDVVPALARVQSAIARGLHAAGFIAYEAAPALDPSLVTHPPRPDLPLVWFGLYARREKIAPLAGLVAADAGTARPAIGGWVPSIGPGEYARRVERIRERIAAGETYQANLTFRLTADHSGDHEELYAALCRSQRGGYCSLLRGSFGSILSASPELFFRWSGDDLEMRPMKGTRPRGRWTAEDDALARELLDSPKERAENLMIVDLLRNDAGRIAEFGSVSVPRLFDVERYPTVLQLTSTVRARTRPATTLTDVLRALFPSGSVTGAPKVSTMSIIREMEDGPRGVYTGAIGFASAGEAVFNVPIRTLLATGGGRLEMGVGSGITSDSRAAAEHAECMQKAEFVRERVPEIELLETMRYDPGAGFHLLDGHLRRLSDSARYFGFALDLPRVMTALEKAVAAAELGDEEERDHGGAAESADGARPPAGSPGEADRPLRVRLLVRSEGEPRVETHPMTVRTSRLRARVAAEPIDSGSPYLYHKTTFRQVYERRLSAYPGYDEVLLVNERGEPTEFTTGNLLAIVDGAACTPPITCGLMPGVEREALLASGGLRERVLTMSDLARADAVYLINSVRSRMPVDLET